MNAEGDDEWLRGFAARVKLARERANLNQYDVADMLNLSRGWAFKVEHATLHPRAEQVARLAEVLNCDVAWLLYGDRDYRPAQPSVATMREVYAVLVRKGRGLRAMADELDALNGTVAAALDDDDDFPVACDNGCPDGSRGIHKFSCALARSPETRKDAPRSDPASSQSQNEGRVLPFRNGC